MYVCTYVMLFSVMYVCIVMEWNGMQSNAMQSNAMQCNVMLCYVMFVCMYVCNGM